MRLIDMLNIARELGEALANSDEFKRLIEARKISEEDSSLKKLLDEYRSKQDTVITLIQQDNSDTNQIIDITNDIERLQNQLYENPLFSELLIAEKEFSKLLKKVNNEINSCIGITTESENTETVCSGNCTECGGCRF